MLETEAKTYIGGVCKRGHVPAIRYRRNGSCVACSAVHLETWRAKHPKLARVRGREQLLKWQRANPDKVKARVAKWRNANIDQVRARGRAKAHKRRAGLRGCHTADDCALIFELQNGRCFYCRSELSYGDYHVDHYLALSTGGSNSRFNLTVACAHCNKSKRATDPAVFAARKGFDLNKRPVFWTERND